jgi:hypothetical protein
MTVQGLPVQRACPLQAVNVEYFTVRVLRLE